MSTMRTGSYLAAIVCFMWSINAMAAQLMSAPQAHQAALAGELVIVDIRSPAEWRETGIADSAVAITMHDRNFLSNLDTLIAKHRDKPIAFICATGGRTAFVTRELEKRGYSGLVDIAEGMDGSPAGPGWLRRNLPLKKP
jgi:rhodanese-related sulfurtransferase